MPIIDPSVPRSFGEILGGLMGAVIDAQAQAARATVDFIEDVGTLEGATDEETTHELRNIKFNYTKKDENDEPTTFTLALPLLSLVEIPAINIKTAKFFFNYDVTNTTETQTEEETGDADTASSTRKWLGVRKPVKVVGRVKKESRNTSDTETNAGITVDVEFEKASISVGLERILDMLELAANENKA